MSEEKYNMNHRRRGLAFIFNHQTFVQELSDRFGSDVDCSNMQRSLKGLGFDVKVFTDLKTDEVTKELDAAAKADHSDADAFVLVYMSHGEDDYVYTKDGKLQIKNITDKFKGTECKSLVGKPKIFIWQACTEKEEQPHDAKAEAIVVDAGSVHTLPAAADFIMCYAVAKGYDSIRNIDTGSWFIQDLCELLQEFGKSLEFTKLLTIVNRKVSKREGWIRSGQGSIKVNQVPCFTSMLTKKLFFYPKH